MFASVLIANRGEIACRIARTAKRLGLRTVAVYSRADAGALHVRTCDEAHEIGPAAAAESYLSIERIVETARRARVDCIHPGYGFLAERAEFAEACAAAGIVFVGPGPAAIRAMGLKDRAKALMEKAGVAVVPGYHGERQDAAFLKQKAYEIGYPVLIKAAAGGGGKGMRRVDKHAEFDAALESATREASRAFGDHRVLIEKYVAAPRHIEFQVFADAHGHAVHLGERDCSLQRRHQKVMEEAPAPGMTAALREAIGAKAIAAARAVDYRGAGTVEFIADGSRGLRADAVWFMEMNTRLQVEHPVTEAITGLDLVEWQFKVAAGEPLPLSQEAIRFDGHAVEARLYAEDPERGFLPATGPVVAFAPPIADGVRVDGGVEAGDVVTSDYDPLVAKLIVHAQNRSQAIDRIVETLRLTQLAGPRCNLAFLAALADSAGFRAGGVDTAFIEAHLAALGAVPHPPDQAAAAAGVARLLAEEMAKPHAQPERQTQVHLKVEVEPLFAPPSSPWPSPWDARDGFQLGGVREVIRPIVLDGLRAAARILFRPEGPAVRVGEAAAAPDATVFLADDTAYVLRAGRQTVVRFAPAGTAAAGAEAGDGVIRAPMHGKVLAVLVTAGDGVHRGQRLAVIEAMKMEHALTAPGDGVVADLAARVDMQVAEGTVLMRIVAGGKDGNVRE